MADTNSVDLILDFLRRNRFTRAEAALRGELSSRPDLNGFLQNLTLEDKDSLVNSLDGESGDKPQVAENQGFSHDAGEVSKELIVKEIQCGTGRNGSESKWKNAASTGERNKGNKEAGTTDKGFTFYKGSEDSVLDLYSWKFSSSNGTGSQCPGGEDSTNTGIITAKSGDVHFSGEKKTSWVGSTSKVITEPKYEKNHIFEPKELEQVVKTNGGSCFKENFTDNLWSRSVEAANSSSDVWKDCSVKTCFPFPKVDISTGNDGSLSSDKKEGKRKAEASDVREAIEEQVDEVGRALYLGKSQGSSDQKTISNLVFPLVSENQKEEFPRLPPVKLKSEDKLLNINWEEKHDRDGPATKLSSTDNPLLIGSYLDVPVGQEINSAG